MSHETGYATFLCVHRDGRQRCEIRKIDEGETLLRIALEARAFARQFSLQDDRRFGRDSREQQP